LSVFGKLVFFMTTDQKVGGSTPFGFTSKLTVDSRQLAVNAGCFLHLQAKQQTTIEISNFLDRIVNTPSFPPGIFPKFRINR